MPAAACGPRGRNKCISVVSVSRQPGVVGTALSFTAILFIAMHFLRSRADDAHEIYTRRSVIGKALNRNPEISPTPPLIFTGGQKLLNLASFSTSLNFEAAAFKTEQDISTLKQTR